jgi:hypothetical protein
LFCALSAWLAVGGVASAAWSNVFQVCCTNCRSSTAHASPIVAATAPAGDACCPQPQPCQQCTTRYVQRCYYQPVTTYKTVTFCEAVTTYRTSYYYEPVTSYRYSCYFDPCTCSYQQVATPCTSYRLRSRCDPVTSYLQRCALQPVQSYQQVNYYEPITTCCTTTVGAPVLGVAPGAAAPAPMQGAQPPTVGDGSAPAVPAPPTVTESQTPNTSRVQPMPRVDGNATRPRTEAAPPAVRIDRIVALPLQNLSGQVVNGGKAAPGAKVLLVSADKKRTQQTLVADAKGRFEANVAAGSWLVYVHGADGKPVFQDKVEVKSDAVQQVVLTSR